MGSSLLSWLFLVAVLRLLVGVASLVEQALGRRLQ